MLTLEDNGLYHFCNGKLTNTRAGAISAPIECTQEQLDDLVQVGALIAFKSTLGRFVEAQTVYELAKD